MRATERMNSDKAHKGFYRFRFLINYSVSSSTSSLHSSQIRIRTGMFRTDGACLRYSVSHFINFLIPSQDSLSIGTDALRLKR
eukprot:gene4333-3147_t